MENFALKTDSYKQSHFLQYPENTTIVNSYIEARGGGEDVVFFGLQAYVLDYLMKRVHSIDLEEADILCKHHGIPFYKESWIALKARVDAGLGLPIEIHAVPEGTVVPVGNVLMQIRNTVPAFFWLPSWLETTLLRGIWYPTSVATNSRNIKKVIAEYMEKSCDNLDGLDFMLQDFGARGATTGESAGLGGAAHLVNFKGSDTLEAIVCLRKYYKAEDMPAFSVPASEHSTMTAWGEDGEVGACRNMIDSFGNGIVSVVSDSYDIFNCTENIWGGELKADVDALGARGGRLVVRPDSGDLIETPIKVFELLAEAFGVTLNSKGYGVLPDHVRVLQGDGLNINTLTELCSEIVARGISLDNFVFGMGGGLLQNVTRDTFKFAMKASAVMIDGRWRDVFKDPVGGGKTSKKGVLALHKSPEGVYTTERDDTHGLAINELRLVYKDGITYNTDSIEDIRERAAL